MTFRIVIPARLGSERLPGKPLADIHGKPMIVWVVEAASRSSASEILVASDDARVIDAVTDAGFQAVMTRAEHPSGSDRVMQVATDQGWSEDDIVLNVQGDEPLIPPQVLDQLATILHADGQLASATLCEPVRNYEQLTDPNIVKVVRGMDGRALYFSRAAVPYARDLFGSGTAELAGDHWWRHIGVYAYRIWALKKFVDLSVGELEAIERLEQLRMLENGLSMQVAEACQHVPAGVDTEQDLDRVRNLLA